MVISWLFNSMETHNNQHVYLLEIAKEIWDTIHGLYSDEDNLACIN